MATKIVTKNSSTASAVPTASDLVQGELAVNVADKRLFTEDNGGSIVELGTNPSTIDINAGTIDGTAIGASSASTGAFTTLTATGAFTSLGIDDNATSTAITIDSSENVGIGTTAIMQDFGGGRTTLALKGAGSTDYSTLQLGNYGTSSNGQIHGLINFYDGTTSVSRIQSVRASNTSDANLVFYTAPSSGGITERMRIDSSGNVGIGTSSPSQKLHISDSAPFARLESTSTSYNGFTTKNDSGNFYFGIDDSVGSFYGSAYARAIYADGAYPVTFYTNATERMRIDSSGNVGIGTSSPSTGLHVKGAGSASWLTLENTTSSNYSIVNFKNENGDRVGYVGTYNGDDAFYVYGARNGPMQFFTNASERMRIDSSGNLLVGSTSASASSSTGVRAYAGGNLFATASGTYAGYFNRLASDGEVLKILKDGTTVGSIYTNAADGGTPSELCIVSGNTGLKFDDFNNYIRPTNSIGSHRDNVVDLGSASSRFDDIYATNGTIQTSDRNEKQDIAELSDAEQRVAVACKGLLRKFRWKDSVAEKGDDARIHFGIIAQDLQAAFEAEGLDAGDYAMFISTTWTDEETNEEKTRMGVRYSELLAFIISAI